MGLPSSGATMGGRLGWAALAAAVLSVATGVPASAACQLKQIGELPVRMVGNQPLIDATINGQPVTILADTGSAFNLIWRGAAERLDLPLSNEVGQHLYGVGGE